MREPSKHLARNHRDTLAQSFRHLRSHSIEWQSVSLLLWQVGDVTERHDGELEVTVSGETTVLTTRAGTKILTLNRWLKFASFWRPLGTAPWTANLVPNSLRSPSDSAKCALSVRHPRARLRRKAYFVLADPRPDRGKRRPLRRLGSERPYGSGCSRPVLPDRKAAALAVGNRPSLRWRRRRRRQRAPKGTSSTWACASRVR
jgi:hypothetical protein